MKATATVEVSNAAQEIVRRLSLKRLHISEVPGQRHPTPQQVEGLALSLKEAGQVESLIVRPHPKLEGEYEIVAGARRFMAAKSLGWDGINCLVRPLNDNDAELQLLVDNMEREDIGPVAELKIIEHLDKRGINTPEKVSAYCGKPKYWAVRRLRLLKVIPEIRKLWEVPRKLGDDYRWTYGPRFNHCDVEMMELIGSLPVETQKLLLKRYANIVTQSNTRSELERHIQRQLFCRLDQAPFNLNDKATFLNGCGPGCASDSSKQESLFDFGDKCAVCLNPSCFQARAAKARSVELAAIEKEHGKLAVVSKNPTGRIQLDGGRTLDPRWAESVSLKPTKTNTQKVIAIEHGKMVVAYTAKALHPRSVGAAEPPEKSKKKTPAAKKSALQARRWNIVHKELCEALKKSTHKQCTENVEDLVTCFGLCFKASPWERSEREGKGNKRWASFDHRKAKGFPTNEFELLYGGRFKETQRGFDKDRRAALWQGLKPVLKDVTCGWALVGDIHKAVPDMRRVAQLIRFPIDERKRAADLTIPVPRTWGAGLDVHTLEPVKLKQLQAALKETKKSAKK